jgi:hypothetical protein
MDMENAPYPTQTAYPTQRAYTEDDMKHKIVMLPGIWARNLSEYGHCEDDFSVKIGSKTPYFALQSAVKRQKNNLNFEYQFLQFLRSYITYRSSTISGDRKFEWKRSGL